MLSESRKVKKYNVTPQGKPLHEDESRFGMKMMKSMGWSVGKGLGREEDGTTDILKVRCKNNVEGLGFVDRNDQWTEHTEAFDSLLSSLNSNNNAMDVEDSLKKSIDVTENANFANQTDVELLKKKSSGISLEKISKNSKVRVHYKKFTKSKDLTQYSEKDLANIFGKKHSGSQSTICSSNEVTSENIEGISNPVPMTVDSSTTSTTFVEKPSKTDLLNSKQDEDEHTNNINNSNATPLKEDRKNKNKPDATLSSLNQENNLNNSVINQKPDAAEGEDDIHDNINDKNRKEITKKKKKERKELKSKLKAVNKTICKKSHDSPLKNVDSKRAKDLLQNVDQEQITITMKKCDTLENPTDNSTNTENNKTANKSKNVDKSALYMCPALESLQLKCDSLNVYKISSFCAEKFSNVDFEAFKGSSLEQIEGYTLNSSTRLHVVNNLQSDPRIVKMWKCDENEIAPTYDKSRKSYKKYLYNAVNSRMNNESKPKLPVKDWKKKNAFNVL